MSVWIVEEAPVIITLVQFLLYGSSGGAVVSSCNYTIAITNPGYFSCMC